MCGGRGRRKEKKGKDDWAKKFKKGFEEKEKGFRGETRNQSLTVKRRKMGLQGKSRSRGGW